MGFVTAMLTFDLVVLLARSDRRLARPSKINGLVNIASIPWTVLEFCHCQPDDWRPVITFIVTCMSESKEQCILSFPIM